MSQTPERKFGWVLFIDQIYGRMRELMESVAVFLECSDVQVRLIKLVPTYIEIIVEKYSGYY